MKSVYVPFRFLSLATLVTLTVISCEKTDKAPSSPSTLNSQTQSAAIDAKTQALLLDITNTALGYSDGEDDGEASDCRVVTYRPSADVYPHRKILDYGSGCTGKDGVTRRGRKIITYFVNPDSAAVGTFISETRFDDYFQDDIKLIGFTRSYVEETGKYGLKTQKNNTYRRMTSPSGTVKTWSGTYFSKQIAGYNTKNRHDDAFEATGYSEGNELTADGTAVKWVSKNSNQHPLLRQKDCSEKQAGIENIVLQFTSGGKGRFLEQINYGDGTCDNKATLSVNNGEALDITLPLYFWPVK